MKKQNERSQSVESRGTNNHFSLLLKVDAPPFDIHHIATFHLLVVEGTSSYQSFSSFFNSLLVKMCSYLSKLSFVVEPKEKDLICP